MFKATEVERKIKEINLLIDMQINLSLCRISYHYFSLSLQQLPWDSIRTKMYHLCMRKILESKQIMAAEKMRQKSRRVYPPEIIN